MRAAAHDGPYVAAPFVEADGAVRILQLQRLVCRAAYVARVAVVVLGSADRAGAADVPVGQEAPVDLAVELLDLAPVDGPPLDQLAVDPLGVEAVLLRVRLVELVVRDAEGGVILAVLAVVALDEVLGPHPGLGGVDLDRR